MTRKGPEKHPSASRQSACRAHILPICIIGQLPSAPRVTELIIALERVDDVLCNAQRPITPLMMRGPALVRNKEVTFTAGASCRLSASATCRFRSEAPIVGWPLRCR